MRHAIFSVLLTILAISMVFAADEGSWFDMQNCEFCKHLLEDPQLMKNMSWEHHKISNGLVSISKVEPAFVDSYKKAREKMNAVAEKMTRGEETHVCNMCRELNSVYKAGAEWNMVNSDNVFVGITNSGNPETVKMIHAWGERTTKEMLDMAQGEHSGHKH